MRYLTVGALREKLEGLSDDAPVVICKHEDGGYEGAVAAVTDLLWEENESQVWPKSDVPDWVEPGLPTALVIL